MLGSVIQYLDVLALIDKLVSLSELNTGEDKSDEARSVALGIAKKIQSYADLLRSSAPEHISLGHPYFKRTYLKSIECWKHLSTSSGRVHYDSLACQTMSRFVADLPESEEKFSHIDATLLTLGFDPTLCEEVQSSRSSQESRLRLKYLISCYISEHFKDLAKDSVRKAYYQFFCQVYGHVYLPADSVDVIVTDAQIFLCVPYDCDGLLSSDKRFHQSHIDSFRSFLDSLEMENSRERTYFPSVGVFNKAKVAPELISELMTYIGQKDQIFVSISEDVVVETLGTMILLMATQAVDKFIIHDAWGHAWQETLCDFEWMYLKMAQFAKPLSLSEPSIFIPKNTTALSKCIVVKGDTIVFDLVALTKYLEADLQGRVTVAINACVAELTADIVEYKFNFIAQEHGIEFPSSSLLQSEAVRLDLTFSDAKKHISSLRIPYFDLVKQKASQDALVKELKASGYTQVQSQVLCRQLVDFIEEQFMPFLSVERLHRLNQGSENVPVTLLQKMQLNLCSIYCAMNTYIGRGQKLKRERDSYLYPEASLDFLMLSMACFFEEERSENAWHLDAFIGVSLQQFSHQFGRALRGDLNT